MKKKKKNQNQNNICETPLVAGSSIASVTECTGVGTALTHFKSPREEELDKHNNPRQCSVYKNDNK